MSMTLRRSYSKIVKGRMLAQAAWAKILSQAFTFPTISGVPAGGANVSVQMWDDFGTFAPTINTMQSNQANDIIANLTVALRGTNMVKNGSEKEAMEYSGEAMSGAAEQAGDALMKYMQDAVIAGLIAATPGLSIALPTGYIDGALPSAATNADMINNIIKPIARAVNRVKLRQGGSTENMVGMVCEAYYNSLESVILTPYRPPQLRANAEGDLFWGNVPLIQINPPSGFGGASNPAAFFLGGRGYALKYLDPYMPAPTADGWHYRGDNHWAWDWEIVYAHGVANAEFITEITNPAS